MARKYNYTEEEVRQKALNWAARRLISNKTPEETALQICKTVLGCVHPKADEKADLAPALERLDRMRRSA